MEGSSNTYCWNRKKYSHHSSLCQRNCFRR